MIDVLIRTTQRYRKNVSDYFDLDNFLVTEDGGVQHMVFYS